MNGESRPKGQPDGVDVVLSIENSEEMLVTEQLEKPNLYRSPRVIRSLTCAAMMICLAVAGFQVA